MIKRTIEVGRRNSRLILNLLRKVIFLVEEVTICPNFPIGRKNVLEKLTNRRKQFENEKVKKESHKIK